MEPDYHSEEQKENTHIHVMRERDHTFENITPNIYLVGLTNEISYTSTMCSFDFHNPSGKVTYQQIFIKWQLRKSEHLESTPYKCDPRISTRYQIKKATIVETDEP